MKTRTARSILLGLTLAAAVPSLAHAQQRPGIGARIARFFGFGRTAVAPTSARTVTPSTIATPLRPATPAAALQQARTIAPVARPIAQPVPVAQPVIARPITPPVAQPVPVIARPIAPPAQIIARPVAPPVAQPIQPALPARINAGPVRLTNSDVSYLDRTAARFEGEIRRTFTPVVDLHVTERSRQGGVTLSTINPAYSGKGPTIIEVRGVGRAGGELELVLTGGASGHVQKPKYGGRPFSVVEQYGKTDIVHLTLKRPGATRSESVVQVPSRGLVTQEGFKVSNVTPGEYNFYYFRTSPTQGGSGGEGSEPELRHVQFKVID